jgi:thioredoxin 1
MNTKKVLFVLATIIIVGGGTIYAVQSQTKDMMNATAKVDAEKEQMMKEEMEKEEMAKKEMVKDETEMVKEESMMNKEESMVKDDMMDKKDEMMSKGSYEAYSAEKIMMAETGDVVLFFHASWCPSCRSLNSSIEGSVAEIPDGVTILKTDYDKETELKKKYGVTTQHTLVQVDKDGNLIKKWSGSSDLAAVISQIQ